MNEVRICHVYPDMLNTYGDAGNVTALVRRLEWRGIGVQLSLCPLGEALTASEHDIFVLGDGGALDSTLLEDFAALKAPALREAAEAGRVILGIGRGFQLMCREYACADGRVLDAAGIIPARTEQGSAREPGDFAFEFEGVTVVGFESHADRTFLDEGAAPLGRVLHGGGNNGADGTEGARYKNVFCSYAHGPLLPKNPTLCDALLEAALGEPLAPLDDSLEARARETVLKRMG